MPQKFVIVGAARTGSTLLVRTLNSLDGVRCHGELLSLPVPRGFEDGFDNVAATDAEREARMARLRTARDDNPVRFIRQALSGGERAAGFKALYSALLDPHWEPVTQSLLDAGDVCFIHLLRRNGLRRYISEVILRAGGPNHSGPGGRSERQLRVHIDIDEFARVDRETDAQADRVRALLGTRPALEIGYEDLAADTPGTVARVCVFLGLDLPADAVEPALRKVGAQDLSATVSNYGELQADARTRALLSRD